MGNPSSFELARLREILTAAGFDAVLQRDDPVDQLAVRLAPDHEGLRPTLELLFVSDLRRHLEQVTGRESAPPSPDAVDYLQFFVNLPFAARPEALPELSRFILLINNGLPLTGLGIREADGAVNFRHLMMTAGYALSDRLVVETVEVIDRILGHYGEDLEALAAGVTTLAEIRARPAG